MKGHNAIQYSDEMQCAKCGKAWDVNDPDPPKCIDEEDDEEDERGMSSAACLVVAAVLIALAEIFIG